MSDSRFEIGSCFAWLLASSVFFGCQGEKTMTRPGDPLPPVPVEAPVTPSDSIVTNIVVLAPYSLSDLDGNGFASELPIAVYLYSKVFPMPFWKPGTLRVELFNQFADGERSLLDRTFGVDELSGLRQNNVVGEFYALQLTLSEAQVRELSEGRGCYRVRYESLSGDSGITSSIKRINAR